MNPLQKDWSGFDFEAQRVDVNCDAREHSHGGDFPFHFVPRSLESEKETKQPMTTLKVSKNCY